MPRKKAVTPELEDLVPAVDEGKKAKFVVRDPEVADRVLELCGEDFKLEAGVRQCELELSVKQVGELKLKYPYLSVE